MFLISKLAWLVLQPLSLAFLLLVAGLVALLLRLRRLAITGLSLSAVLLFVTLFTSAGTVALQSLEDVFERPEAEPSEVACMIVLGGAFETEVMAARGGLEFNQSAERFVEATRLALKHPQAQVIVSGGDGSFSGDYEGDAAVSERFFASMGVDTARLVKESTSRTTHENAANTRALVEGRGLPPCLLITSAFHMPRSMGLFRAAGIPVVPWPVDYRTSGRAGLAIDFSQPTSNAQLTATAAREWLGLAAYWAMGRIGTPLPRP